MACLVDDVPGLHELQGISDELNMASFELGLLIVTAS